MTSLEALALSYAFTVLAAFMLIYRAATEAHERALTFWRTGIIPNMPTSLADNRPLQRALRVALVCVCFLLATTWFTSGIVWLVLRRAIRTVFDQMSEVVGCQCDKCQIAHHFTGTTSSPQNKLEDLRDIFDERCPNCGVDLHLASLCFHQPVEEGVCISQWDDMAESQELLEVLMEASLKDESVVDAMPSSVKGA